MSSVTIHPPKTPITRGSNGVAKATLPNVCKIPGPPAPFVPSPLPNIARSGLSPQNYSTTVKIEGHAVAIRGATFGSVGDAASKPTGGGLLSANTHGPARFITPGSLSVKIQSKGVHLLGDPVLNNCGPGGNPPNTGATMTGTDQKDGEKAKGMRCSPTCESLKVEKVDRDEKLAKLQQEFDEAQQIHNDANAEHTAAEAALKKGKPSQSLRQKAVNAGRKLTKAAGTLSGHKQLLDSALFEKKVAEDCGGAETWRIVCTVCNHENGDFDVVTADGRVKECKSGLTSAVAGAAQFKKLEILVEKKMLLGPKKFMKTAVKQEHFDAVAAAREDLKDRLQGH